MDPGHEGADPTPGGRGRRPVKVVPVVAAGGVALDAETLDEEVGGPALEGAGAAFDALHAEGAGDEGHVRGADRSVSLAGDAVVGDC